MCIQTGQIVWINGPFPCGPCPDIVIFRRALIHQLDRGRGEMVEADNGYGGEPQFIRMRDEPEVSTIQFIAKARARARHEAVNGRMKIFGILKGRFRHDLNDHGRVTRAIAVITNLSMGVSPTFHVDYPAPGNT